MKLPKAARMVREDIDETLTYYNFPSEHWRRIRTNNPLERIMREIRRRTRVVGAFPDGNSALMLVAARLRHIAGTRRGMKRYLRMERLFEAEMTPASPCIPPASSVILILCLDSIYLSLLALYSTLNSRGEIVSLTLAQRGILSCLDISAPPFPVVKGGARMEPTRLDEISKV